MREKNCIIITLKYPPLVGGASTYYKLLSSRIQRTASVTVIAPIGSLATDGVYVLPYLVEKTRIFEYSTLLNFLRIFCNSIIILLLLLFLRTYKRRCAVLVHSGLTGYGKYINPFWYFLSTLYMKRIVFDIRDRFPKNRNYRFFRYATCIPDLSNEKVRFVPLLLEKNKRKTIKNKVKKQKTIGWIGDLSESKNIHVAIKLCDALTAVCPNLRLLICGENRLPGNELKMITRKTYVEYLGKLRNSEIDQSFYSQIDLLLFTSINEGVPRSIYEAISNNCDFVIDEDLKSFSSVFVGNTLRNLADINLIQINADKIRKRLDDNLDAPSYDLSIHHWGMVAPIYNDLLWGG